MYLYAQKTSDSLALCQRYSLSHTPVKPTTDFYLQLQDGVLSLCLADDAKQKPLAIDFCSNDNEYRRLHGGGLSQAIAKAVGLKANQPCRIIDATAGLGRDAFVLASLGAHVTLIERSAVLFALLENAHQRGLVQASVSGIMNRMMLVFANALDQLPLMQADIVLLDPMFPHRAKSALVKKELRWVREVVGDDDDADLLLALAKAAACQRVVVKRSSHAGYLADTKPDYSLCGQSSRFDIYLTPQAKH